MTDYSFIHKDTYDVLADEYEGRVENLQQVTNDAMNFFSSYLKPAGHILDIGCAVGIAISILGEKGFRVSGIEISPNMAEYARKRNPKANIIVGDFLKTNFIEKFDGVLAFAFIHLFPKKEINGVLAKIRTILKQDGVALLSTTESDKSSEGWHVKSDFNKKEKRFRKFWTENELNDTLIKAGFTVVALKKFVDPYGKKWMDFIVKPCQNRE